MNTEDKIKEIFAEKLGQLESPVNPDLWNAIASQVGTASAASAGTAGISVLSKVCIGIGAASLIGIGTYFLTKNENTTSTVSVKTVIVQEQRSSEQAQDEVVNETVITEESDAISNSAKEVDKPILNDNPKEKQVNQTNDHLTDVSTPATPMRTGEVIGTTQKVESPIVAPKEVVKENKTAEIIAPAKKDVAVENTQTSVPQKVDQYAAFELTKTPNIFVLNASGYFSISYKGEYQDFQFTLMDTKNRVIFSSNDPNFEWRGMDLSGNQIEPGNYLYIITVVDKNGKAINKYSQLTIINQ